MKKKTKQGAKGKKKTEGVEGRPRHLVGGDSLLHHDSLASGQGGSLAGDEGAVLGPDHGQVALSHLGPLLGGLQLPLEPAHAGQVC